MKKKILIVDDSALMRRVICDIISSDDLFQATDTCRDGLEAYEKIKTTSYDAVLLDVNMPRMDGLQLLEKLQQEGMKEKVIMVSSLTAKDTKTTMIAMELGAVDIVTKPSNIIEAKGEDFRRNLLGVLKAVTAAPSVRRGTIVRKPSVRLAAPAKNKGFQSKKLVALACSTGGPKALQSVIPFLDKRLDAPMVLVQHMPAGFTKSMSDRLNELSEIQVKEAEDNEILQKGTVYVAPGGKHLKVQKSGDNHRIVFGNEPAVGGLKPCADIMYESLKNCDFGEITCVVLTGMGADGTKGILSLREKVPVYVIAQDEASCVVYGMPKAIAEAGVVDQVVPLDSVAQSIMKNVGVR